VNGGNINLTALGIGLGGDINMNATRNLNILVGGMMNIGVLGAITETCAMKTQTALGVHNQFVGGVMTTGVTGQIFETCATKTETAIGMHQQNAALQDINGVVINLN